jgi:hypothetical protein
MTRAPATSFIVRVWSDDEGSSEIRGEVEHVGTGEKRLFLDYASLTSLIEAWRRDLAVTA